VPVYKIARHRHLGETLDLLKRRGLVTAWSLRHDDSTALWSITGGGTPTGWLKTRYAEEVVQRICDEAEIRWRPVPTPGGEDKYAEGIGVAVRDRLQRAATGSA